MGMLSKLLARLGPSETETQTQPVAKPWTPEKVADILRHFPLGARILYSPEFKKELRLETVLLGCSINHHRVFSQAQVRPWHRGSDRGLELLSDDGEVVVSEVDAFHLLVPHQTRTEIDYREDEARRPGTRMVQHTVNDFERGGSVTLMSFRPFGRVPHLEATVRGVTTLTSGYYANHKVVLLDPFPNSLFYRDKRVHQRIVTKIPGLIRLWPEGENHPCVVEDFSERFFRVKLETAEPLLPDLVANRRVLVTIDSSGPISLQGTVYRSDRSGIVVELKGRLQAGRIKAFDLIEQLELKALLLHHPETQEAIQKARQG